MNLRNVDNYNIGLDIGTNSVGWAASDEEGNLCSFDNKPAWGSRLYAEGAPAAGARVARGQRRRYIRRRWRLNLLQGLFAEEMEHVDADFFIRLNQSRLHPEDRSAGVSDYRWPLFNGDDFTEKDYYKRFPTIYHLRKWLMETDEKADIRLVYLACHNIVKHRGNFLRQGEALSARDADTHAAVERLCDCLSEWCGQLGLECDCKNAEKDIAALLERKDLKRGEKKAQMETMLFLSRGESDDVDPKKMAKAVASAVVGLKAEMAHIFLKEGEGTNFELSNDEAVEAFLANGLCPDEGLALFEAVRATYSSFVLMGVLKNADGDTLSAGKCKEYEQYKEDLALLKRLVRTYAPNAYDSFFRGAFYENAKKGTKRGTRVYDVSKADGYTKYDLGKLKYDEFKKRVESLLKTTAASNENDYRTMMERFEDGSFLRRLKTSDNGSIPYQLHLEELSAILDNQGKHYPFLAERKRKIESLVTFRIPYYVGPLQKKNAAKASDGSLRFAWSVRKEGAENTPITPWNWEDVIDKHASAEAFIKRMTGTCTYLQGEPVLPKCSLLYEEFCVLNELNGARWSQDGDDERRFDYADRIGLIKDVFCKRKTVSYKRVADWMSSNQSHFGVRVKGGQGESGFESKLSSYIFFTKDVFQSDEIAESDYPMVEEIILWSTLFEDRAILESKVREKYGDRLTEEQIAKIKKKRFSGWGRLSKEFLVGLKMQTDEGPKSVMDILREGNPNNVRRSNAMVLMEVLHDDVLGLEKIIDERNRELAVAGGGLKLEDLPGSPALRRSVNQALRIVEEIVGIAGKPPANVFIEVTRDDDRSKKGKRTKRVYDSLKESLAAFKAEDSELWRELNEKNHGELDERLELYFRQRGKSLYSGKPLSIDGIQDCEIDHILPRTYIKDDSIENKALVLREENQRKLDTLTLNVDELQKRAVLPLRAYWKELRDAGLIGEKKYKNLTSPNVGDRALKGFIARQLVETSQVVKYVQNMLAERYPESNIRPVKASISHDLRERCEFVKCREANDFHHAHDAYLASEVGRFIQLRHPQVYENPIALAHSMKKFIRAQGEGMKRTRKMPGTSSFIVESFLKSSGFSMETGEVFDDMSFWNAEAEVSRIRRYLDYKQCFISRMPEETSGAFWDATIYSPRDRKKSLSLPLKSALDPGKYGSYSREQFAYFFAWLGQGKKGKPSVHFDAVPVRVASTVRCNPGYLLEYAEHLAEAAGELFVTVLREKVHKYQLLEIDGNRLYVTGLKEVRNATQFAFSQAETKFFSGLLDSDHKVSESCCEKFSDEVFDDMFGNLIAKFDRYAKRLGAQLKVSDKQAVFSGLSKFEKAQVLLRLVAIANAQTNMIDLSAINSGTAVGCMRVSHAKCVESGKGYAFVDQSVTGMFERRQPIVLDGSKR